MFLSFMDKFSLAYFFMHMITKTKTIFQDPSLFLSHKIAFCITIRDPLRYPDQKRNIRQLANFLEEPFYF